MESKTKKDWRFWVFLGLSILWSIRVFWLLFEDQYFSSFSGSMPLNEVGDFLAGSFSPLAFAWLAYGYWMQNKELKDNTKIANDAKILSETQFLYLKIKDENLYQPIFKARILRTVEIDEKFKNIVLEIKTEGAPAFDVDIKSHEVSYNLKTILPNDKHEFIFTINTSEAIKILDKFKKMLKLPHEKIPEELKRTITIRKIPIEYTDRIGLRNRAELLIQHSDVDYSVDINNAIKQQKHSYDN